MITYIGTLPPVKGQEYYDAELINALCKEIKVQFFGFQKLYPTRLYPGGDLDFTVEYKRPVELEELDVFIKWYDPRTWIKAVLKSKYDQIHVSWWAKPTFPIYFTILLLAKLKRKKTIITVHNITAHEPKFFDSILYKLLFLLGDKFIVHTENNEEQFRKLYGRNKKVYVMHHPPNVYGPKIDKTFARTVLNLPLDKNIVLFFGHIREYKGVEVLLDAMRASEHHLYLVGQPWYDLRKLDFSNVNYSQNFNFIPSRMIHFIYSCADVVVLPYKHFDAMTGHGSALYYELPMVVTRVGGLPLLTNDENCVANPNDPKDLRRAIDYTLEHKEELSKMSKGIANRYTWEDAVKVLMRIYNEK